MNIPAQNAVSDEPFLAPVERPQSLIMRIVYAMTQKQFGKVLTPLKVWAVRLPPAFGSFVGKISQLDKKLVLPKDVQFLVRQRVAQINTCSFCIDIGRFFAMKEHVAEEKMAALEQYDQNPLFSERERAALDYVTEITRDKHVSAGAIARLKANFSEREICEIAWLVAGEHVYNTINIGLNIHSDMLCSAFKPT
jgi:alkylhydroperoxidase family enzyme